MIVALSTTDIGWTGLAASLVLVAITVAVSMSQRLNLERRTGPEQAGVP